MVDCLNVDKIYPNVEELSTISTVIDCTEPDCKATFKSTSNLNLHLAKKHNHLASVQLLTKSHIIRQFFCPDASCVYNKEKSFSKKKYLKQHYLKVHLIKLHACPKCHTKFSTESQKKVHEEYCGIKFSCPECGVHYNCYETLISHAKRKKHTIFSKIKYKGKVTPVILYIAGNSPKHATNSKLPLLLPKNVLESSASTQVRQSMINDIVTSQCKKQRMLNRTRETQTQNLMRIKTSAGTQTDLVSVCTRQDLLALNTSVNAFKKSIKTQTNTIRSNTRACNTSFDIKLGETSCSDVQKISFGTQTLNSDVSLYNPSVSLDTGNDLLQYINETNFCNSNMETQTDWLADFDLLSTDIYSNTYTQTCDEILPPALQFNNTHTQTVFNDMLRSVGSQTTKPSNINTAFMSHIETQTDQIFRELLQDINS